MRSWGFLSRGCCVHRQGSLGNNVPGQEILGSFDEPSAKFPAPLAALEQFHDAVGQLFGIPFVHPDGAIPEMLRETGFLGAHDREFVGGGNGGRQTGKASGIRKNAQKRSLMLARHFLDRQLI